MSSANMRWSGAVVAMLALASARVVRADPAEVEALIRDGNQMRRDGQSQKALPLFQKAHDLAHSPRTEAQLGLVEMDVGYFAEAEKHLVSALEFPSHPFIAGNRAALEKALERARTHIGEIAIEGEPAGAAVVVNGRPVGALPLASAVRLAAGRAEIAVTAPGHAAFSRAVAVRGGERQQVRVRLEKLAAATAAAGVVPAGAVPPPATPPAAVAASTPSPGQTDEAHATSGLRVAAWVTAGAAVLALGVGVALNLAARDSLSDSATFDRDRRLSIAGYVAGGALAVTSAILFWQSRPSAGGGISHARLRCAPGPAALLCRGEF